MQYINVKSAAEKWGITTRRIISLIRAGRIVGANRNGNAWQIPIDAIKPYDKRARYSVYEKQQRRIVVAGINLSIGLALTKILLDAGYSIIGLYDHKSEIPVELRRPEITLMPVDYFNRESLMSATDQIGGHLDGFVFLEIFFNMENVLNFDYDEFEKSFAGNVFAMNILVRELVKKMNYQSSIVIQNSIEAMRGSFGASAYAATQAAKENLIKTFANVFSELYGVRINSVMAGWISGVQDDASFVQGRQSTALKRLGQPDEIADDIFLMLTRHKYTTGASLISDGGYLAFDEQSRSEDLGTGKFYVWLHKFFTETKKGDHIWATSTMMNNEWTDDAMERQFKQDNLDAVQRGVKLSRVFLFRKRDARKLKNNPNIITYATNKQVNAMWADLDEVVQREPEAFGALGDGWVGINDDVLLVDLPPSAKGESRGYATMNKREIARAKKAFNAIKKLAQPLNEIL
ncbi:MAG: SDR family oxidoreductase [Rickettsiales bacterium]|jgi:NAD(P)-dependent dehydrogenase (short-subunit alcohol dehydrogenase family)|nr:SDR family oxidoreductase [Rickettsiales bacterium]